MALIFVLGVLVFAIIPGMQTRVVTAAGAAPPWPSRSIPLDSNFAFASRIGGWAIDDGPGLRSIYPIAAVLTVSGSALARYMLRRDRKPALSPVDRQLVESGCYTIRLELSRYYLARRLPASPISEEGYDCEHDSRRGT